MRLLLPHWVSEGSLEELFRRLRDSDKRSRMKEAMVAETARIAAETGVDRWDEIRLARVVSEPNHNFQGLTIAEISRRRGADPETTVMDLVLEERCQATMYRIFRNERLGTVADVVGPLCTPCVLRGDCRLPDVGAGDVIAILDAGMYAESDSHQLNRRRPSA